MLCQCTCYDSSHYSLQHCIIKNHAPQFLTVISLEFNHVKKGNSSTPNKRNDNLECGTLNNEKSVPRNVKQHEISQCCVRSSITGCQLTVLMQPIHPANEPHAYQDTANGYTTNVFSITDVSDTRHILTYTLYSFYVCFQHLLFIFLKTRFNLCSSEPGLRHHFVILRNAKCESMQPCVMGRKNSSSSCECAVCHVGYMVLMSLIVRTYNC